MRQKVACIRVFELLSCSMSSACSPIKYAHKFLEQITQSILNRGDVGCWYVDVGCTFFFPSSRRLQLHLKLRHFFISYK